MVLYGPPGTGKTTLARLAAEHADAAFEELSAVQAGRAEVREVIARARERKQSAPGRATIFFLDEIHRFNKAQQDALLPAVEEGLVTLIGATTENPYFEVNSALLSRTQIYQLEQLTSEHIEVLLRRAIERGECPKVEVPDDVIAFLAARAGGDARAALNALELACTTATGEAVTLADAEDAMQRKAVLYDKGGDQHYDYISAWIKSTRGSDPDASLYYLAAMLEGGEDARFIARRMIILASEDIGNADPQALPIAVAAAQAVEHVGLPGGHGSRSPRRRSTSRWRRSRTPSSAPSAPCASTSGRTAPRARPPRCSPPPIRAPPRSGAAPATTTRTAIPATSTTRSTCRRASATCASTTPTTPRPTCASGWSGSAAHAGDDGRRRSTRRVDG